MGVIDIESYSNDIAKMLLERCGKAMAILNSHMVVEHWHESAYRLLGWHPEEVQGKLPPFLKGLTKSRFHNCFNIAMGGGRGEALLSVADKMGRAVSLGLSIEPLGQSESGPLFLSLFQDESLSENVAAANEPQDDRWKEIANMLPDTIIQFTTDSIGVTRANFVSDRVYDLLGLSAAAFMEESDPLLKWIDRNDRASVREIIDLAIERRSSYETEFRIRDQIGGFHWVQIRARPVEKGDGTIQWFALLNDVTYRRELEDLLQEKTVQLMRQVDEEVAHRMQNERLLYEQSKLAAISDMIGAITHQWNQPLNEISLTAQDLQDAGQFGELTEQYLSEGIASLVMRVDAMSGMIDAFRKFFKPDTSYVSFSVLDAIHDTITLFSGQFRDAGVDVHVEEVQCDRSSAGCALWGYPGEFRYAILNLLESIKKRLFLRVEGKLRHGRRIIHIEIEGRENSRIFLLVQAFYPAAKRSAHTSPHRFIESLEQDPSFNVARRIIEKGFQGIVSFMGDREECRVELDVPAAQAFHTHNLE